MKRQLLFAALLVIGFNASAQFTKGEKVLSGNLSFNAYKSVNTSNNSASQEINSTRTSFNTNIGWVKSEKRIKGFRVSYSNNVSKFNSGETKTTGNTINLGIFNQRIKSFNQNFFGFFESNLNGSYSWNKYASSVVNGVINHGYGINANGSIGLGYRITKNIIADATLNNLITINYNHTNPINTSATTSINKIDEFTISTGLSSLSLNSVAIGFRYVFQ
jgi:hypothetical protein